MVIDKDKIQENILKLIGKCIPLLILSIPVGFAILFYWLMGISLSGDNEELAFLFAIIGGGFIYLSILVLFHLE